MYNTPTKETEDNTNIRKGISFSWIGRIILLKWPYYLRQSADAMQSQSKDLGHFSKNYNKPFQICMETQNTQTSQNILEEEYN